jgi:RNA polymerase sigma factor (sigma-70 family)
MPNGQAIPAAGLRHYLSSLATSPQTDAELLDRFVATRDDFAFAELVRRHGPVVLAICRRVTRNRDDAEDAFQATFLVLARKAGQIRRGEPLGAWLYGVAVNTARVALSRTCRRRARETLVTEWHDVPGRPPPVKDSDDVRMLLEEVARLSDGHRKAVVLCELEGRSRSAAAKELGIPEGTLSSRLAEARHTLAARLCRRGVTLSVAGLSLVFAQVVAARPSADLTARTVASVVGSVATTFTPALVAALFTPTKRVLRVMSAQNLKIVPAALGLIAVVAIAAGLVFSADPMRDPKLAAGPTNPPKKITTPAPSVATAKPLPKGPNKLLFYRRGDLVLIDPDGKNDKKVADGSAGFFPGFGLLSPDGKSIAYLSTLEVGDKIPVDRPTRRKLYMKALDEKDPGTDLDIECGPFVWSPDGTEIAFTVIVDEPRDKVKYKATHGIVNVKTKEKTALKLPDNHEITDWSRDGRYILTTEVNHDATGPLGRLCLMNRDGTEHKAVTTANEGLILGKLSPDGTRVLCVDGGLREKPNRFQKLRLVEMDTGKSAAVDDIPLNAEVLGFCWSPDGKCIAYIWREVHEGKPEDNVGKETESFLVVCDANGKNAKTIATEKANDPFHNTMGELDWR